MPVRPASRVGQLAVAGAVFLALVLITVACGLSRASTAAPPSPPSASAGRTATADVRAAPPMNRSVPVSIDIPAIDVHTSVMGVRLRADGTVQVPPIERNAPAGWYEGSPTPGQRGPAVLLGHVTVGDFGQGVFYRLAQLAPGAQVKVTRADGKRAVFTLQRTAEVPKSRFPGREVYGDTDKPELRLITCGGPYDQKTHSYPDNIVVFATLTRSG